MSMLKILFVFGVLAVSLRGAQAVSAEDKRKFLDATLPRIMECSKEIAIPADEPKKGSEPNIYDTLDPCIMACVFKKNNMQIDDQGLFDAPKAEEFITKYTPEEADKKKVIDVISKCKAINMQEVSDGKKGCDRAKLLLDCYSPIKAMFSS